MSNRKKRILIHSNFCRALTGFGKNKKNIMQALFNSGEFEIAELANGVHWEGPETKTTPWKCFGALPDHSQLQNLDTQRQRAESYGFSLVDKAIEEFKPDIYLGIEDIWFAEGWDKKFWWDKINTMIWTTIDSQPLLPLAVDMAPKIKNYYVWSPFAEKDFKKLGYDHVKTIRGSLDTSQFKRLSDNKRSELRLCQHIKEDDFIIGFVFRNQLRKSIPNLLDGFSLFSKDKPEAKLLLHTSWSEGWDIPRLLDEKKIDKNKVLTTHICHSCKKYQVKPYHGENGSCSNCGANSSLHTVNISQGASEAQLNEIYNLMDVYCHPFTSGGQEIPIQEAKLTELITLVTDYSCGEDNASPESGGLPLAWSEYREPQTQFIKASTCPNSINSQLQSVYDASKKVKSEFGKRARKWVIDNFSIEAVVKQLTEEFKKMPLIDWDFKEAPKSLNDSYKTKEEYDTKEDFIIDLHKNILHESVDKNSSIVKHWSGIVGVSMSFEDFYNHMIKIAREINQSHPSGYLEDALDEGKRIAVVIPKSANDVFLVNGMMKGVKKNYPDHDIYFFTEPNFFSIIEENPYIHKCLPYNPKFEDAFFMEGISNHEGLFEICYHPHNLTQKIPSYIHNGKNL